MKRLLAIPALLAALAAGGCGDPTKEKSVHGDDATTVLKIERGVQNCRERHEGYVSTVLPGNTGYGSTSAVVTVCKDGTVLAEDD